MKLSAHLHIMLKLRLNGVVPLLPLYAFYGVKRENVFLLTASDFD
jgi:hypothetical protein